MGTNPRMANLVLAGLLAIGVAGDAAADLLPEPEFFPEALAWMDGRGLRDACLTVRVRKGQPSEIAIHRSSGNAEFDALVATGLRREIDVLGRFPLDKHPADAAGWRTVPMQLALKPDRRHTERMGCAR